jgi:hypothetical protein
MTQKTYKAQMTLDEAKPGTFKAVYATLNVIDHDNDVTLPGAFLDGQKVIIEPWNHGWSLPPGKGIIHADDSQAWVDGEFFMDTECGRDHYNTVKNLGDQQEWSYTFDVLEARPGVFDAKQVNFLVKMDTVGVSPVTRGAGIGTRTEFIKSKRDPEGEAGSEEDTAGKPSGVGPVRVRIEIFEIEEGPEAQTQE